jgi:hypothetical protein
MNQQLQNSPGAVDRYIRRKTIIGLSVLLLFLGGVTYGFFKLKSGPLDGGILGGIPVGLRKVLDANEKVFSNQFDNKRLAKEYPKSVAVKNVRVNGDIGMSEEDFDVEAWRLYVMKANGDTLVLTLDDIRKLPKTEVVHNFKCIEGWSQITWWGGVRFADFVKHFGLDNESAMKYVGMMTPDEEYYVGIDMPSALQPQTLICYEMNGKPLPVNQGYPVRLIIPVKYGIKSIKRIGSMYFRNEKPPDYWAERGYDYYSGL